MQDFIKKTNKYAVVGASRDRGKYGNKVLRFLKERGFKVVAVNPKEREIEGVISYPDLKKAGKVDVAVFVVPPRVAEKLLRDALESGIEKVWLQPGSESDDALSFCKENGMDCISKKCIMVEIEGLT